MRPSDTTVQFAATPAAPATASPDAGDGAWCPPLRGRGAQAAGLAVSYYFQEIGFDYSSIMRSSNMMIANDYDINGNASNGPTLSVTTSDIN